MRLEPLYRMRFSYPEGWAVELEGGWQHHFYLAEGRCEGAVSGRLRGANFPQRRTEDGRVLVAEPRLLRQARPPLFGPSPDRRAGWRSRSRRPGLTGGSGPIEAPGAGVA